jgi:cytosine/adenosine deaminase-related metal-dependent hydrolase
MRIISARWVIPLDAALGLPRERPYIAEGAVAIADDGETIVAVGPRADVRRELPHAREERAEGALLPGLVNAHCHLELSALADAVPGGAGLVAWATALMRARTAGSTGGAERKPTAAAAAEAAGSARRLGTASIGDVGNSLDAVAGIGAAGLDGVVFHELLGSREAATGDALADAARDRDRLRAAGTWPARLDYVPAPHAPYSAGPELMRRIFAAAAAGGHATSVHVAEDEDELALLRDGSGRWRQVLEAMGVDPGSRAPGQAPVAYLASLGAFETARPPLLVHMVHASGDDRRLARKAGATVVLCPRSNLHIGGRLPDVEALLDDGLPLALGTDSLASTPDLSLWGEMATLCAHFPSVPGGRWLEAATSGGARALGLSDRGALAPGKRPGVLDVLVDDVTAPLESLVRDATPTLRWTVNA